MKWLFWKVDWDNGRDCGRGPPPHQGFKFCFILSSDCVENAQNFQFSTNLKLGGHIGRLARSPGTVVEVNHLRSNTTEVWANWWQVLTNNHVFRKDKAYQQVHLYIKITTPNISIKTKEPRVSLKVNTVVRLLRRFYIYIWFLCPKRPLYYLAFN